MRRLTSAVWWSVVLVLLAALPAHAADEISDGQWYHQFLKTAQAHQVTRGDGVTVAVIDTGVDAGHPDLAGSVLPGIDLTGDQGDGRVDKDGHGTGMASLIAAHGRVKGVAPGAKILSVRYAVDKGRSGKLADAIQWATRQGVKVISISIAGSDDLVVEQDVRTAIAADVVVVAAAGNRPADIGVQSPANIPGVVAVGGVDAAGNHSSISVSGPQMVIVAPSDKVSSAAPGGKHTVSSGTSDATAIVSGAVALVRAKFPQLKAPEVVRRLTATAIDKGSPGRDPDYGHGVLNIVGALTAEIPAATSSPKATTTSAAAAPPSKQDEFPWWVLIVALPIVIAAAVAIAMVMRSRRRETM